MHLREQLATIIHDGVENGEFQVKNIDVAARAVYEAITRFQHPYFVAEPERRSDASKPVVDLLVAGLEKGVV